MGFKLIEVGATAGNANADIVVPAQKLYMLNLAELVLTTNGTAANRRAIARILDGAGATVTDYHAGMTVPANQSAQHHQFMQGTYRETAFIGSSLQCPFGGEVPLLPGWTLRFLIDQGVAGDSFAVKALVEER